jgi:hypothetical protein
LLFSITYVDALASVDKSIYARQEWHVTRLDIFSIAHGAAASYAFKPRTVDYPWTGRAPILVSSGVTSTVLEIAKGLRSRVRRFESCRGHFASTSMTMRLTSADAKHEEREPVSLVPLFVVDSC